jgi:uncharacterized membrane protein YcaP (DUF421 family)
MDMILGVKDHVSVLQECARAVLVFFYGLLMLRLSGTRSFGKFSALDVIMSIIVGSALARVITGDAPIIGTFAAVALLTALHVVLGFAVAWSSSISKLVEGCPVTLVRNGVLDDHARVMHMVSKSDLEEALREKQITGLSEMHKVKELNLEPNGNLTIIKT